MAAAGGPDLWELVPPQIRERLKNDDRFKHMNFDRPRSITEQAWLDVQPSVDGLLEALHNRDNAGLYKHGLDVVAVIRMYKPLFDVDGTNK
jgi:hypothetical protein